MNWKYLTALVTSLVLIMGATISALSHGAHFALSMPSGPIAYGEWRVLLTTALLPMIVVIPLFILLFYFAWRYRASNVKNKERHNAGWDHTSLVAEFLWWVVPTIIIVIVAVIMWRSTHRLDPYMPIVSTTPGLTIQVVALDWKWLFIYPDEHIATINMLEIPAQTPIHFELTADAPMNSFWIPDLGGQIMVMPGMKTQLNLLASTTGKFMGVSANISGEGFAGMQFTVRAVSQSDFSAWVHSVHASTTKALTPKEYASVRVPSSYNKMTLYTLPDDTLFQSIIERFTLPATTHSHTEMSGMRMNIQ